MNTGGSSGRQIIREFTNLDSIEDLTDLLHESYAVLADLGLNYVATYQDVEVTRRRIERGVCFVAEIDTRLVGTITYYPPSQSKGSPWLDSKEVAHMGQLGVRSDFRMHGLGTELMGTVEKAARHDGARELALDTAEPATHLIEWYERLGYRFIEYADWEMTNYRSVIMSKTL